MHNNNKKDKGKNQPIIHRIETHQMRRQSQDIKSWRSAIQSAESIEYPDRRRLYELYNDCLLDGRLLSLCNKRIGNIANKKIQFIENDTPNNDITKDVIETPWFYEVIKLAMQAIFWGHSLIELDIEKGKVANADLIPRTNVRPEFSEILMRPYSYDDAIKYNEEPENKYVLSIGKPRDLGILLSLVQYVIYKRGSFGDWAQFNELFGMPLRIGKYHAHDEATRRKLANALGDMGSASYTVIPKESDIEFHETAGNGNGYMVYDEMRKACNEEMTILILGQTMTTQNGSSRSQAEVHAQTEEDIELSDMIWLQYLLNWQLKELLSHHDYNLQNGEFCFYELKNLPKEKHLKMLIDINNNIAPIDPDYIEKTFNVPLLKKKAETESSKKKINNSLNLKAFYDDIHSHDNGNIVCLLDTDEWQKIFEALAKLIHKGDIKDNELFKDLFMATLEELSNTLDVNFTANDADFVSAVKTNIGYFSGAKTLSQIAEMQALLLDGNGNIKPFEAFKNDILGIHNDYNVRYLQAEQQQVIAAAQSSSSWKDYEETAKDLPYLKYRTVGDGHVRPEHKALDGTILKMNDSFWNKYLPPNDWGCRCTTNQLTNDQAKKEGISKNKTALELGDAAIPEKSKALFARNVGKNPNWFDGHPYFEDVDMKKLQKEIDKHLKK